MSDGDLVAFLKAELDKDEGRARLRLAAEADRMSIAPAFALRVVAAHQAIIAAHPLTDRIVSYGARDFPFGCETCHDWDGATEGLGYCDTLKALAAVYSDHPDYRAEEWKPLAAHASAGTAWARAALCCRMPEIRCAKSTTVRASTCRGPTEQ